MYITLRQPRNIPVPESAPIICDHLMEHLDYMIDDAKYVGGLMNVADPRHEILGAVESHLLNALAQAKHLDRLNKTLREKAE